MNIDETEKLLLLIEGYDRSSFKPAAIGLWSLAMGDVVYQDAVDAVHQIFRIAGHDREGDIRKLLPADVKRPALAIGEARRRKSDQAAIAAAEPAKGVGSTGRSAKVEALLAEARAKAEAAAQRYREPIAA